MILSKISLVCIDHIFVDKYSGERVNQQTIYMTGAGYEVTLKGIKEKCRSLFLKYGKFEDPNF